MQVSENTGMSTRKTRPLFLKLPPNAYRELAALAENAERLAELVSLCTQQGPAPTQITLAKRVSEKLALPVPVVRLLIVGLTNLLKAASKLEVSSDHLLASVIESAESNVTEKWTAKDVERLKGSADFIATALSQIQPDHPILVSRKAEELGYKRVKLLTDSRIITDLRPVFDDSATRILESVITHTLWIEYIEEEGQREIEIAIDMADIANLRRWCERAERKAVTLKKEMAKFEWPTAIVNESDDMEDEL